MHHNIILIEYKKIFILLTQYIKIIYLNVTSNPGGRTFR